MSFCKKVFAVKYKRFLVIVQTDRAIESGKKLLVRTSSFHLMVIYDIRYKPNVSAAARGSGIVDGLQIAVFE